MSEEFMFTITADSLGAFAKPWATHATTWRNAGLAAMRYLHISPILACARDDIQIRPTFVTLTFDGIAHRAGIIPMSYPRRLPPNRAGSALAMSARMTLASAVCVAKPIFSAAAAAGDTGTLNTVVALIAAARMGAIEAFSAVPGVQNSDVAARTATEYSTTTSRVVAKTSGANAAEDLWIASHSRTPKVSPDISEMMEIAREFGPLFVMLYAMISENTAMATMAELTSQAMWDKFVQRLTSGDTTADDFDIKAEWIRSAVIFETGRWIPEDTLHIIATDPVIAECCLRRAQTTPEGIAASREKEAHLRATAVRSPIVSPTVRSHLATVRPPTPTATGSDEADDATGVGLFVAPTPAPNEASFPRQTYAFQYMPMTTSNPVATRPSNYLAPMMSPPPQSRQRVPSADVARLRDISAMMHSSYAAVDPEEIPLASSPPAAW
jgi:hypothetical protein